MWRQGQIVWIDHRRYRVKQYPAATTHASICSACKAENPQFLLCSKVRCLRDLAPKCYLKPDPRKPKEE